MRTATVATVVYANDCTDILIGVFRAPANELHLHVCDALHIRWWLVGHPPGLLSSQAARMNKEQWLLTELDEHNVIIATDLDDETHLNSFMIKA